MAKAAARSLTSPTRSALAHAAVNPTRSRCLSDEAIEVFRACGVELMFAEIRSAFHSFRADFDFFHEDSPAHPGRPRAERLRKRGADSSDEGGAVWLGTTALRRRQGPRPHCRTATRTFAGMSPNT